MLPIRLVNSPLQGTPAVLLTLIVAILAAALGQPSCPSKVLTPNWPKSSALYCAMTCLSMFSWT